MQELDVRRECVSFLCQLLIDGKMFFFFVLAIHLEDREGPVTGIKCWVAPAAAVASCPDCAATAAQAGVAFLLIALLWFNFFVAGVKTPSVFPNRTTLKDLQVRLIRHRNKTKAG